HVDPRFTRTSAKADLHVPIRAGADIAFLGGLINYVLTHDAWFHEYVTAYTNAAMLIDEEFLDTEDLAGVFSGYDDEGREYEVATWQYEGEGADAGARRPGDYSGEKEPTQASGSGGARASSTIAGPRRDEPLRDPRCVFRDLARHDSRHTPELVERTCGPALDDLQRVVRVLARHCSRYSPEMVERTCGVAVDDFLRVARALTENSGRDRTSAFCYAVGWTQHTVGVQYIRTASILQLLRGNIGRPGGG